MAGQYRFKDINGNVVAQISSSADGTISFSGSAVDFSNASTITLGQVQLAGTASNALLLDGFDSTAFVFTSSFNTISQSISSQLNTLQTTSGSNIGRLNNLESKSSSVDISISNINTVTESVLSRTSNLESKSASVDISISNINSVTASNIARLSNLESKSSSVDISISNINSFTASNGNTSLNNLTGSLATTGSNTFFGTQTYSGSVYIANDLIVQGSSSIQYISASSVSIGTNIVQLNTANPSVRFAGLTIIDSGSVGGSGSFLYDSVHDEFIFVHRGNGTNITSSHFVLGPETYDSLGNETYLTTNRLPKGTGKEHLVDSNITATANDVTITSTIDTPMFILQNINSSSYSQIQFKGDTKDAYIFKGNSTYGSYGGANALNFYTDSASNGFAWHPSPNTNAMVLSQAGNLGLNVGVSPTNLLHLAGASATPSLRLGSVSVGYHWDIGRENATTGDFVFNYTANGTFVGTFARITTAGLFGIGVTASGTYGKLSVAGGIRTTNDVGSKLELGRYNADNPYSYIKLGTNATSLNISNAADSVDLFYFTNSGRLGIGRSATTVLDVAAANAGNALTYMQNTDIAGYSGIDFFRQCGVHAGSVWVANDSAGATNNRNALTIAARVANEKVIIVGGGYDPTITGGLTITGANTKLEGTNAYHMINSTAGLYSYIFLNNQAGGAGNERTSYFIQNTYNSTANGVAAGAAYMYFGQGQNMEFSWAGVTKASITSAGVFNSVGGGTSDLRTKQNIDYSFDNGIESILKLQPTKFKFKNSPDKQRRGFIAQDVLETIPDLVLGNGEIEGGTYGLDYDGVLAIAVKAIQELKAEIELLKNK
jgi:hypothetical protein